MRFQNSSEGERADFYRNIRPRDFDRWMSEHLTPAVYAVSDYDEELQALCAVHRAKKHAAQRAVETEACFVPAVEHTAADEENDWWLDDDERKRARHAVEMQRALVARANELFPLMKWHLQMRGCLVRLEGILP